MERGSVLRKTIGASVRRVSELVPLARDGIALPSVCVQPQTKAQQDRKQGQPQHPRRRRQQQTHGAPARKHDRRAAQTTEHGVGLSLVFIGAYRSRQRRSGVASKSVQQLAEFPTAPNLALKKKSLPNEPKFPFP